MTDLNKALDNVEKVTKAYHEQTERGMAELRERLEKQEAMNDRPRIGGRPARSVAHKALAEFARTGKGLETKDMEIGTTADGGALVPEQIADEMLEMALSQGNLPRLVRNTQAETGDYKRIVNARGQVASWVSETGTRSETGSAAFREVAPTSGELYSYVGATTWLMQDSKFDLAEFVVRNAAAQFARALETAVLLGTGSSQPTGILTNAPVATADDASPVRAANVIERVEGGSHLGDDLVDLYFALRPEYRRNASFVMSSATLAAVRKLRDANGSGYLFQPRLDGAVDAGDGTLLGKPVFTCEDMTSFGDGSPQQLCVLCGDFQQGYELVRIGDMTILRDPYSTKGRVLFYIAQRFAGKLTDNDAIKVLAG